MDTQPFDKKRALKLELYRVRILYLNAKNAYYNYLKLDIKHPLTIETLHNAMINFYRLYNDIAVSWDQA